MATRYILITGKIGSGKSYVANMLREKHYIVLDSDSLAKRRYDDPVVFKSVVTQLGPKCIRNDGTLDVEYMRNVLLDPSFNGKNSFLYTVVASLSEYIEREYSSYHEIVFIEAAPTMQLGQLIRAGLNISSAIVVHTNEKVRKKRLMDTRKMSANDIKAFDKIQNLNILDIPYFETYTLKNCDDSSELNYRLMDIIEQKIRPNSVERLNLYKRYLESATNACKDNAICYSFFNLGGCNKCPFPCKNQDRNYDKLNASFRERFGNA